jgi:hypothetical protein
MSAYDEKPQPAVTYSWVHGVDERQVTPSVRDQPIEDGRAKDNNAARFVKKREGLYVVLVPIEKPEACMKIDDGDNYGGDEGGKDRS